MTSPPTILLAGGGTGGHLYPGISVAESLRQLLPGARPLFLCTTREIDRTILQPTGFEFIPQPIIPPKRSIAGLLSFWRAWRETKDLIRKILTERQPVAILGLGGYAAGAAVKLAALAKIPAAILNPDVIPGKANQYLMQYVQAVCCQFDATSEHISPAHREKLRTTGCPIRHDILHLPARADTAARLGLNPLLRTLTITGASQGAQTVNEAIIETLKSVRLNGWQVLHLAGKEHADAVRAGYREINLPARVIDFTPAMADIWAITDLAISRSGASSCAELTACGIPSLLMPYPFHKDLHQRANARELEKAGAAVIVDDEKDRRKNAAKLTPLIESLLYDGAKRQAMAAAAKSLAAPAAADEVARVIIQMIANRR
ncbi:MAG TPA: UDP-N-acetylglucosamine--N-acetylmuramyl-(pentapeptide) pyrophosphoryl-undecaprenol N-acetylglucosamine transferase [Tepidisphaeraceae bacterium]|jgi:UDP-N-acetylglucosamine--N-acetylmuramyl-(pentapeptide) pyrophosphoryl-undecaprenol N-acetylglucosamine transferase